MADRRAVRRAGSGCSLAATDRGGRTPSVTADTAPIWSAERGSVRNLSSAQRESELGPESRGAMFLGSVPPSDQPLEPRIAPQRRKVGIDLEPRRREVERHRKQRLAPVNRLITLVRHRIHTGQL